MKIVILPPLIVNQIAAGEIISSPFNIIKELLENSIDANSTNITIKAYNGGKSLLSITDNGTGIHKDDLPLTIHPHATSKLKDFDMVNLNYFGFRGEALASIASISKIKITSRLHTEDCGYTLISEPNKQPILEPSNIQKGTKIDISDIFFNIPARLKFLRSDSYESSRNLDIIRKIALSHPHVSINYIHNDKSVVNYVANNKDNVLKHRVSEVLGDNFINNSLYIDDQFANFDIKGYVGLPTTSKSQSNNMYVFINSRIIKDKFIHACIMHAYEGLIVKSYYPQICIFININPEDIDVNVSPNKTEIKLHNPQKFKSAFTHALKSILTNRNNQNTDSQLTHKWIDKQLPQASQVNRSYQLNSNNNNRNNASGYDRLSTKTNYHAYKKMQEYHYSEGNTGSKIEENTTTASNDTKIWLGNAITQILDDWVIAQNDTSLVLVDKHAAHERINYQKLLMQLDNKITKEVQRLLFPEVIELNDLDIVIYKNHNKVINNLGFITKLNEEKKELSIEGIPSMLTNSKNITELVYNIILDLADENGESRAFEDRKHAILSKIACHTSIRSNNQLSIPEINALLRQIEETEASSQCPHGRPCFVFLTKNDLNKIFQRI